MTANDPWPTRVDDEARFRELSDRLADAIEEYLPAWIERSVAELLTQLTGRVPEEVRQAAARAGAAAGADVGPRVRAMLAADLDAHAANPLHLLRDAVSYATAVLRDAGVPPVHRDPFAEQHFPADVYGLSPATWADVHPDLHEIGLAWSAGKAFVFKARRRSEGFT